MEQINKKLFTMILESAGSNLYSRIYSKLRFRKFVSRYVVSYHKYLEFDSDNKRRGLGRRENSSNFNDQDYKERLNTPQWESIQLKPFEKNFYTPSETILNRSTEEIAKFRETHNLSLLGDNIPNPILEFSDYEFSKETKRIFFQKRFEKPTPIQSQGWPIAFSGRDFVGIGQTGSGKTLGFAVPGLIHVKHQPPVAGSDGPIGLVMVPTRELAQQIHEATNPMFISAGLRTACLFGGAYKYDQAKTLSNRPSFCIATPGRLLDFLESGITNLKRCTYLVLDEADRMFDMGFERQIKKIMSCIRPDRQTLMWSATWPKEMEDLATDFLSDSIRLNVGSLELFSNPDIKQEFVVCNASDKRTRFMEKMIELTRIHKKILVFTQKKSLVDNLVRNLHQIEIKAKGIHKDYLQESRKSTLDGFREGRYKVLVATDFVGRGLDIDDITLVVNFDFPNQIENYVHRIGRTGRAGKAGEALSFLTSEDSSLVRDLIKLLQKANQEIPPELFGLLNSTNSSRSVE